MIGSIIVAFIGAVNLVGSTRLIKKAYIDAPLEPRSAASRTGSFLQAGTADAGAGRPTRLNRSWKRGLPRKSSMLGSK